MRLHFYCKLHFVCFSLTLYFLPPAARTLAGAQGQRQRVISQSGKIVVAAGKNQGKMSCRSGETGDWQLQLNVWL